MHSWQYAPLLLASGSPRRRQLLDQAGFNYRVQHTDVAEVYPHTLTPEDVAPFLAAKKMQASFHLAREDEIILTADSVVILDGDIYGKPTDRDHAIQILEKLQGRTHIVVTAICMARKKTIWSELEKTKVTMASITNEEIKWYVDTYGPFDKAGAYGVQEWIGLCKITQLEGTYANVMGLPVHLVYRAFQERIF